MKPTLRPATEDDFDFAFNAKKVAMGHYIALRWGWDEAYQLAVHHQRWSDKPWFIILLNAEPIGTVSISEEAEFTRFGEFYILPEFQRCGFGSIVLVEVLAGCDVAKRAVRLEHLKWNPVGTFYARHGFKVIAESDNHFFLAREPEL